MQRIEQFDIQYVIDATGEKSAVILPIEQFYELLEDLEDLAVLAERKHEPTIPHQQVVEELTNDGLQN
jgi:hypothetical protein